MASSLSSRGTRSRSEVSRSLCLSFSGGGIFFLCFVVVWRFKTDLVLALYSHISHFKDRSSLTLCFFTFNVFYFFSKITYLFFHEFNRIFKGNNFVQVFLVFTFVTVGVMLVSTMVSKFTTLLDREVFAILGVSFYT